MVDRTLRATRMLGVACVLVFAALVHASNAFPTGGAADEAEPLEPPRRHIMMEPEAAKPPAKCPYGHGAKAEPEQPVLEELEDGTIIASMQDSNFCLDAPHVAEGGGTEALHLWLCHGGANQYWHYTPDRHLINGMSRQHLDAGKFVEGAVVEQQPFAPASSAQRWEWTLEGQLKPDVNPALCVDIGSGNGGGALEHGMQLVLAPCDGRDSQRWTPGDCMDTDELCEHWASEGECEGNAEFMIGGWQDDEYSGSTFVPGACRASCRTCAYETGDGEEVASGEEDGAAASPHAAGEAYDADGLHEADGDPEHSEL